MFIIFILIKVAHNTAGCCIYMTQNQWSICIVTRTINNTRMGFIDVHVHVCNHLPVLYMYNCFLLQIASGIMRYVFKMLFDLGAK